MAPSSRFALSLKPRVAYLDLNFCALWKKQTTLPSWAYAGIPYQVLGARAGALALTMAWSRSAMARSDSGISAIFASTSLCPSALPARRPRPAPGAEAGELDGDERARGGQRGRRADAPVLVVEDPPLGGLARGGARLLLPVERDRVRARSAHVRAAADDGVLRGD